MTKKIFLFIIIIISLFAACSTNKDLVTGDMIYRRSSSYGEPRNNAASIEIKSGPGFSYHNLGTLSRGLPFRLKVYTQAEGWVKIEVIEAPASHSDLKGIVGFIPEERILYEIGK